MGVTSDVWPACRAAEWQMAATFGGDGSCIGRGSGEASTRLPGALVRGGDFVDPGFFGGSPDGPFAINARTLPSTPSTGIGFRGAR